MTKSQKEEQEGIWRQAGAYRRLCMVEVAPEILDGVGKVKVWFTAPTYADRWSQKGSV